MKLTRYKLGEILELQRGYDLPSSQMKKGDILVAGSNGVIGYHNEARSNHPCITEGEVAVWEKFIIMNRQHGRIILLCL